MKTFKQGWPRKFLAKEEKPKPELEGFRIVLRPPCLSDYSQWASVRAKNKNFLTPYEPEWAEDFLTKDFFLRRLERQKKERKAHRGAFFLIHHKAEGGIIGGINLNDIRLGPARHASLGYWLDENHQGQGYMREAGKLVIDYAFNVLKLKRLNAACLPDNDRSIKLLHALGFDDEGFAKAYLQINGTWQDHRLFGLLVSNHYYQESTF